jgi:2-oxoglutarate ferredoxin oxidoreductase subunit alpha
LDRISRSRINDLVVKIATVNGTGSASANAFLMQAIFRMGIPVSGKNVFPSNIQGLPTWYEIRANKDGHVGRSARVDLMVAMNPKTYSRDIKEVLPGGAVLYDSSWPLAKEFMREDVQFFGVPLSQMCIANFRGSRQQILMKNVSYVGVLAALLDINPDILCTIFEEKFGAKPKLVELNNTAVKLGHDFALENFQCPLQSHFEIMDGNKDSVIMTGNMAAGLGCVYAGATVGAWYPITPSTSLMDAFRSFCEKLRKDPETKKNRFCVIQAEDELAAIGMVLGASWMGARSFTPTSGPGISLMGEFIGLAYYAEIPAVLFDIQRTGPSTGMPTRTQQGDILTTAYASHGDTKHIALFPADPGECFHFAVKAFDLAERFQTPVFVVSDLDIGMNDWVCDSLEWDDNFVPDRGKVLSAEDLENLDEFHRYLDVDGDGIPYRSLPGVHPKGSYFTRGSGHDKYGRYTEDGALYEEVVDRIREKVDSAATHVPKAEIIEKEGAQVGVVTIGGCRGAALEAVEELSNDGLPVDYLRVRGFPFGPEVEEFLLSHEHNIVVEQNRDAQLMKLLALETDIEKNRLESILDNKGSPLSAGIVVNGVKDLVDLFLTTANRN